MRNKPVLIGTAFALLLFLFITCSETVSAEEVSICRGDVAVITTTLLQNGTYGNPVPNQPVEFFDQTLDVFLGMVSTDVDGDARFEWSLPSDHPLGPTIINVTYRGNETLALAPSFQWTSITILSPTEMNIQLERSVLSPEDTLSFMVLLSNDMNYPMPHAQLTMSCNGIAVLSGITNSSGWAGFVVQCDDSWAHIGENDIRIVYEQNLTDFSGAVAESFTITVEQVRTSIEVEAPVPELPQLNDTLLSGFVLRADSGTVPGAILQVALDGVSITTALTDASGAAYVRLVVDTRFALGPHTLTIAFPGSFRYAASSSDVHLTVSSAVVIGVSLPEPVIINADNNITVAVGDLLLRPIADATVILCDLSTNETLAKAVPAGKTSVSFIFRIEGRSGARSFLVTVVGNEYVTNRTHAFSAIVWSRPDLTLVRSSIRGYASPSQHITFEVSLYESQVAFADTLVEASIENTTIVFPVLTNTSGIAVIHLQAPQLEGSFNIWIAYQGNLGTYRMSAVLHYRFIVSRTVPLSIELDHYTVIPPLQRLEVVLIACALNGSLLEGVNIHYEWLSVQGSTESTHDGMCQLYLPVPEYPGLFNLSYQTEASSYILSCSGKIIISLNGAEVAAAQGIGITGIIASICISLTVVVMPIIRKRYVLG